MVRLETGTGSSSADFDPLLGLIHEGIIDLNPTYQRGTLIVARARALPVDSVEDVVWPEQKQIKVLDSIWRNYYVPPVVFAVYYNEDGLEVRHCVDGKQRLTSIQKFFDGQVSIPLDFFSVTGREALEPFLRFKFGTVWAHVATRHFGNTLYPFSAALTTTFADTM